MNAASVVAAGEVVRRAGPALAEEQLLRDHAAQRDRDRGLELGLGTA